MNEKRKAEIALALIRYRLKQTGELSGLLRGDPNKFEKETGISRVERFNFINWEVRMASAKSPNTGKNRLLELAKDKDKDIRRIAVANLNQRKK